MGREAVAGISEDGRGRFRTCDLSRVKCGEGAAPSPHLLPDAANGDAPACRWLPAVTGC
jgi:hypothetical protein